MNRKEGKFYDPLDESCHKEMADSLWNIIHRAIHPVIQDPGLLNTISSSIFHSFLNMLDPLYRTQL